MFKSIILDKLVFAHDFAFECVSRQIPFNFCVNHSIKNRRLNFLSGLRIGASITIFRVISGLTFCLLYFLHEFSLFLKFTKSPILLKSNYFYMCFYSMIYKKVYFVNNKNSKWLFQRFTKLPILLKTDYSRMSFK